MQLVLIETFGNQAFIFASNKLKENIGASEMIYRVGTEFVLKAARKSEIWDIDPREMRKKMMNSKINPSIQETDVEVVLATSGKAYLITKDEREAQRIIQDVTLRTQVEMPGIDVAGVYVSFNWELDGSIDQAMKSARECVRDVRSIVPSPRNRFHSLPFSKICTTSGWPAAEQSSQDGVLSRISLTKRKYAKGALERFATLAPEGVSTFKDVTTMESVMETVHGSGKKEDAVNWYGVIHADGNGVGQIFLNFYNTSKSRNNREFIDNIRKFSFGLDLCTENAYREALKELPVTDKTYSLVPIVVGGDDLTVICDGRKNVMQFVHRFLTAFEEETRKDDEEHYFGIISKVAVAATGVNAPQLSSCAGVVFVKKHYPFSEAYHLADQLINSAKTAKVKANQAVSSIDYHVLYDSSSSDLMEIREKLHIENFYLYAKPYIVTDLSARTGLEDKEWFENRAWRYLAVFKGTDGVVKGKKFARRTCYT